jgi:hypothetical protein
MEHGAAAHDRCEDAMSRLDAAHLQGDERHIARLERGVEHATHDRRPVSRRPDGR